MNAILCEQMQPVLDEWARGGPVDAESSREALAHAAHCAECRDYLEGSQALSRALGALAAEDAGQEAPPRVGEFLQASFREARGQRRGRLPVFLAVGTAAAVVLAAFLGLPHSTPAPEQRAAVKSTPGSDADSALVPPLYGDPLEEGEAGEVVRVSLPVSELRSMGFAVSEETTDETVEADVLIGEDGVARTVQFVE